MLLHEDEALLILNKPAGMPSAPLPREGLAGARARTAVHVALDACPALRAMAAGADASPNAHEPGLVHRLDTETSGLLVFAKSAEELARLRALWTTGRVAKVYRAWVAPRAGRGGHVDDGAEYASFAPSPVNGETGTAADPLGLARAEGFDSPRVIDFPLANSAKSARRMIALTGPVLRGSLATGVRGTGAARGGVHKIRGRPMEARTEILRVFQPRQPSQPWQASGTATERAASTARDLEIRITTGVRHQIRCHLAAVGWPIVGDTVYGGAAATRLWLHSWRVEIPSARADQAPVQVEAPLPDGWAAPTP